MDSIVLNWKNFNVDLQIVEAWAKANLPNYIGCSADTALTLWLSVSPTEYEKTITSDYWSAITEASAEATNYVSQSAITSAIQSLKDQMISKSWDQMSVAEKKLLVGQTPTKAELGL